MAHYTDLFVYGIICGIIGARIYYVAFSWSAYKNDLLSIFNLREGGLAVYGGIIAGILFGYIYCRVKKLNILQKLDIAVLAILIGQIVGRWGNFFNREAFGEYTDGLFAMQLPVSAVRQGEITELMWRNVVNVNGVEYIQVHPTFLYESLGNLCVLLFIILVRKHMKFKGEAILIYMMGYGFIRFWVEALRTDQLLIGNTGIPVSRALSACIFLAGLIAFILIRFVFKGKVRLAYQVDDAVAYANEKAAAAQKTESEKTTK